MANTNNQDTMSDNLNREADDHNDDENFEVSNQGQNLGGGSGDEKTISIEKSGGEFSKTDQSVSQAAPGQTATNTNQGGSNA